MTRAEAKQAYLSGPLRAEAYRESLRRAQARAEEDRDRREWITGLKRRLGLVCAGDVAHRARVSKLWGGWGWFWSCRMEPCGAYGLGYGHQWQAFEAAWDHATMSR